ncbi:RBBP9/YdeN family alpha/beta hydrolase [Azospira inquinata]|uniref:Serine hydrolase family protein n=1 Tax=Azospira inquinata TaxID=2785627 RepID=A0A975XV35_9RHOO|nr:alpha/beta fold hydrolase [Azospira inquinata]QWT45241.1 serine hydrolase family protein [Azospira inquinata]QWT49427.1 serine hydrolase family protein [Azospira inquinata]
MNSHSPVLILPGYQGSGPSHWQSRWQALHPEFLRVEQADWAHPDYRTWRDRLEAAVAALPQPPILVAHSLGCLLTAFWAGETRLPVKGALLVAPPNSTRPDFPPDISGFGAPPRQPLPFPTVVVASSDDPYGSLDYAADCAAAWGARFVAVGPRGHINADSGLGDWPEGYALLESLF